MAATPTADDPALARLLDAVRAGDATAVAQALRRRPALARARGPDGETALHVAAECDDARLGTMLLAGGADPEARYGGSAHTALSWAITCESLAFARAIVAAGVDADLFCAAGMGALERVLDCFEPDGTLRPGASRVGSSRFAADGARLPSPPDDARDRVSDAMAVACRTGQDAVVVALLARGGDPSFRAFLGATPLHWAYFGGSAVVVDALLAAGADPQARDDAYRSVPRAFGVCAPAAWGLVDKVRARLDADPALATFGDGVTSALHEAARSGHADVVRLLLERGADPRREDGAGRTAIAIASEAGHARLAARLERHTGP